MEKIITDLIILKTISKETTREEVEKLDLKVRLQAALTKAWAPGCGLAAIQIGIPLRYAWFNFMGRDFELINPVITRKKGTQTIYREGCLSIPDKYINTTRALRIEYVSDGKKYKAKGFKAAVISHEIDHMNGILNTERVKR